MTTMTSPIEPGALPQGGKQPLYKSLLDHLRKKIETGEIGPGERVPSESELIAEFRVSSTTARRCLDELANSGLVQRIRGRGTFVTNRDVSIPQRHIAYVYNEVFDLTQGFCTQVLQQVGRLVDPAEYRTAMVTAGMLRRSGDPAATLRELVRQQQIAGLLILSPMPQPWFEPLIDNGLPMVSVNFSYDSPQIYAAVIDFPLVFHRLVRRLVKSGHRRIVWIRPSFEDDLLAGVHISEANDLQALEQSLGCEIIRETFMYSGPDQTQRIVDKHLGAQNPPTAFVAIGYDLALQARHAIRTWESVGVENVALVFVGGAPGPTDIPGEDVPCVAMAEWSVKCLLGAINGRPPETPIRQFACKPNLVTTTSKISQVS